MAAPTVSDVLARVAAQIDPAKAAEWDVSGLQLGDSAAPIHRLAVCHEVTESVVTAVEHRPPDLLLTYHPLLFRPVTSLRAGRSPSGRALRLIRAGVSLGVVHTSFDVAPGGAADALAEALGLTGVAGFGPVTAAPQVKVVTFVPPDHVEQVTGAMAAAGAGIIGSYTGCSFRSEGVGAFEAAEHAQPVAGQAGAVNREPEVRVEMVAPASREGSVVGALARAHPYEEPAFDVYQVRSNAGFAGRVGEPGPGLTLSAIAERVATRLGEAGLRVSGDRDRVVERVAVVPGSGSSLLSAAVAAGADVVVTGDVTHHRAVEALDRGMAVIDPGHAPTERPGIERLVEIARSLGPEVVDLGDHDPTPWR